ncbi:MAG TPA: MarR family winged helix-turn-helix transcriptional regulator [Azospirillum sp.]
MPPSSTRRKTATHRIASRSAAASGLNLSRFLPYRLSVLSNTISQTVARLYEKRFHITIPEWRIIAVLGGLGGETLSAGEIATATAMDKVQVSRAISRMLDSELILREAGDTDRRKALLTLTAKGQEIYREIAPLALAYEARLTSALDDDELQQLNLLLGKLQIQADELTTAPEQRMTGVG